MSSSPALPSATPTLIGEDDPPSRTQVQLTDQTNLLPFKKIVAVFLGLGICVLVTALDSVIVATALPTISSAFNAGSVISWVPSAYMLTSTCFQPLYGRFSDIFGRKSAMTLAMTLYMIGNLIAGFSKNIIQMIVARGIAGAGGGGIVSLMQIIVSDIVTLRDRGKYQGFIGVIVAAGYCVGPLIGGALAQKVGWSWCFWITVPVSFFATIVVIFVLPLKPVGGGIRRKLMAVDYLGSLLTLVACALVVLPLIWGGVTFPWSSAVVLAPLFCGILVAAIFCLWEWKGAKLPIVPMYIFRHMTVVGVYISMFVNGFVFFSSLYYLPQYFQAILGLDAIDAGVLLIPVLVGQMAANWVSGWTISKTGRYRSLIYSGFAVSAIGSGCLATVNMYTAKAKLVVFMLLTGIGLGQTMQTTTVAAQASVPRRDMSVVTAFRNFVRLLGGTLSLAIGSAVINNSLTHTMVSLSLPSHVVDSIVDDPALLSNPSAAGISQADATFILNSGYTTGFHNLFIINASLTVVAFFASLIMIKHKNLNRTDDEERKREGRLDTSVPEIVELSENAPIKAPISDPEMGPNDHRGV